MAFTITFKLSFLDEKDQVAAHVWSADYFQRNKQKLADKQKCQLTKKRQELVSYLASYRNFRVVEKNDPILLLNLPSRFLRSGDHHEPNTVSMIITGEAGDSFMMSMNKESEIRSSIQNAALSSGFLIRSLDIEMHESVRKDSISSAWHHQGVHEEKFSSIALLRHHIHKAQRSPSHLPTDRMHDERQKFTASLTAELHSFMTIKWPDDLDYTKYIELGWADYSELMDVVKTTLSQQFVVHCYQHQRVSYKTGNTGMYVMVFTVCFPDHMSQNECLREANRYIQQLIMTANESVYNLKLITNSIEYKIHAADEKQVDMEGNWNRYQLPAKQDEVDSNPYVTLDLLMSKRTSILMPGSPEVRLKDKLKLEIGIQVNLYLKLFESLDNSLYSQALRRICTIKDHVMALKLATVLLSFSNELWIDVDERAGETRLNAIEHAKKVGNKELETYLIKYSFSK